MAPEPGPPERGPAEPPWERVKDLVADALERDAETRAAYLDTACAGDPALRAEVDSLLAESVGSAAFLARPVTELFSDAVLEPGARLGQYTLRGVLGEGGMGRVWEATQERPHRTVALKVLRPGILAGDGERRFQWEVEALGRLGHPAIARVHEAGVETTDAGQRVSWFAMEKVDGRPLLAAADALGLDRAARLELFVRVCEGVAHAHRRGVIHRDLKPDNILVDDAGAPHLLDFGIARAADPHATSLTVAGEIVGTLAYMSPEQFLSESDAVDARSDVYALGVILFRMLTGRAPLELDGLPLAKAALRLSTEDPPLAGSLDRGLRGDLETILATGLAREPERRYPTVDALAADVRRALRDEPIAARPPTAWYQLTKFARRNRGLVAGVAAAVLGLVAAVVGTSVGLVRADNARERAEVERDRSRDANQFLKRILASADPDADGRDVRVFDLLEEAGADLERDTEFEPAVRAGLHLTLGETYRRLGLSQEARTHLSSAVELFEETDGVDAETTLEAHGALCEVCLELGDLDAAEQSLERVRAGAARAEDPPDWLRLRPLELEGSLAEARGDYEGYLDKRRAVFEAWSGLHPEGHDSVEAARTNLSNALLANGHDEEADALLARGIEVLARELGPDHPKVLTQRGNRALALSEMGEGARALELFEGLTPLALKEWGPVHAKTLAIRNNHATALMALGRRAEALPTYEELSRLTHDLYGPAHRETVRARNNESVCLLQLERWEPAVAIIRELLAVAAGGLAEEDPVLVVRLEMNLASALSGLDRNAEALEVSGSVLVRLEELVGEGHQQSLIARNNHAILQMRTGHETAAVETARRNQDLAEEHYPGHPYNLFPFRMNLGRTLAGAGRFEDAERELLAVEQALRADPGTIPSQTARIREVLAETYAAWGRPEDAARWAASD